ncbi:MAG: class I SAM-dependent methyltransferase [Patescibacteria group bacterium]|nr:class I SAM-dependent methyltransferase [Patescibacteria group bacterium]
MSDVSLNETSYVWKQIAQSWGTYFDSPSRPSKMEVDQYKKWLKNISEGKTGLKGLVLGATPELRDALVESNFNSCIIDINWEMILAMTELLKTKNPNEVIIKANWLNNPLQNGYFDVVLGDAVLPNLPWEKRDEFYCEIKRLLKTGGYFMNRAFFVPEKKPFANIDELLKAFAQKPASNKTALELVFEIQILTHSETDHLGSMEKVVAVVEKLRGNNGFNFDSEELNKTLDIVWDYWLKTARQKIWIYPFEREEEAEYKKYFETEAKFCSTDHPYGKITPMYLLKS